ncbi:MAG TPA: SAM-dependent methyltransferase [Acidimicrobiales bacterium]
MTTLSARLAARIRADGAISYAELIDAALYDDEDGFYATRGSAGRRGDFLTSVEVGPLFGEVLARALDDWWRELGRPVPFRVVEVGAGRGTLARAVVSSVRDCLDALDYVMVERSRRLSAEHPTGPHLRSMDTEPDDRAVGVVLANELLDNLPFDLLERRGGEWHEVRVDVDDAGVFHEVLVPSTRDLPWLAALGDVADGARVPVQDHAAAWLSRALGSVAPGRVVVIDYVERAANLVTRPWTQWVRTYREHERGGAPLDAPGAQDVTCEVVLESLAAVRPPDLDRSQAAFLHAHGIDELVAEGRRIWAERAHLGDLTALRARSRVREAEALCDPAGLGAFRVLEWLVRA